MAIRIRGWHMKLHYTMNRKLCWTDYIISHCFFYIGLTLRVRKEQWNATYHTCITLLNFPLFTPKKWVGQPSRYSDWLRARQSGIESGGDEIFPSVQTGPWACPPSYKMGTGSFPGVKCGRGVLLTTLPLLVPRSWKSRAISLPTIWATPGR